MVTNDATILRIKHEILYEVAKLAWNDQLEDGRDDIPYKISPGPQAQYRCCVRSCIQGERDCPPENPSGRR